MNKPNICSNCGHDESKCTFEEAYRRAKELIAFKQTASAGILQHDLKMSYEKSVEILDWLEQDGYVGPADGAKPREVLIKI
jgi:S-DNA-T family DNA segregation ATPase FtsK/SpoIIIE